ncbi:SGNH/GDSL hydrolase family protein [Sphingomonas sp. HF-S4]|uniref:SGNH/GDSL hydrolase family protein n=1 Tax=Sphingomonas agrestis TaxID=3080540 RepID=A0ABU3Y585_9SPHN|nr:SGNH/GDSL hydrolase family protein [Sphingomonas sp. HF-S4]MDV3456570.1 SGNH/GDSL hydrolase family protein [Sphingomonas sp. HF-S4]
MRWIRGVAIVAGAVALAGAAPAPEQWTPAWTASMWQGVGDKQQVAVDNATISFAVRVGAEGGKLRLRLSNEYGPALRIGAASVRVAGGPSVKVMFDGQATTILPANAPLLSDAVPLAVKQFDVVEVSLYLPEKVSLATIHGASGAKTSISATGDNTAAPFTAAAKADMRPLLAGIDVLGAKPRPVIVAYGDSITDNTGCALDAVPVCRWSDVLGRRLAKAGKPHVVVTQAISGNRVLSMGTGPSALSRFDRDVLSLRGVTHLVLLEGINDIGSLGPPLPDGAPALTAEQLIQGYRQLIARAHDHGIKVIAMTVLPYEGAGYYSPEGEAIRVRVNDWIRTSRAFDGVIDMEKVVADPANPKKLNPALQRGDNLHPHGEGEAKMGEAIDLGLFK